MVAWSQESVKANPESVGARRQLGPHNRRLALENRGEDLFHDLPGGVVVTVACSRLEVETADPALLKRPKNPAVIGGLQLIKAFPRWTDVLLCGLDQGADFLVCHPLFTPSVSLRHGNARRI